MWRGKEREILEVWEALKAGLTNLVEKPSYLGFIASELLTLMNEFEKGNNHALLYCPFNLVEEDGSTNAGLTLKLGDERTDIVLTPEALRNKDELVRTLIHELIHVSGIIGEDEEEDENVTTYITNLIIHDIPTLTTLEHENNTQQPWSWAWESDRPLFIFLTQDHLKYLEKTLEPHHPEEPEKVPMKEFQNNPAQHLRKCTVVIPTRNTGEAK